MSNNHLDDDAAVQLQADLERIICDWTGMQAALAAPMAKLIAEGMQDAYGGQRLYIPARRRRREVQQQRTTRDVRIAASFNARLAGSRLTRSEIIEQVMKEFEVSRRTVYAAIKRAREVVQEPA